jgi:zinc D-Ala-D-Ala carboxypeptidase
MTKDEWSKIKWFQPSEFDDPTAPGSGEAMMDYAFVERLDYLRRLWGRPLVINSGYRSQAHNIAVGGVKDSAHQRGLAADIQMHGLTDCIRFATVAAMNGLKRIGVDMKGGYVHLDSDLSLPSPAVWFYNVPA